MHRWNGITHHGREARSKQFQRAWRTVKMSCKSCSWVADTIFQLLVCQKEIELSACTGWIRLVWQVFFTDPGRDQNGNHFSCVLCSNCARSYDVQFLASKCGIEAFVAISTIKFTKTNFSLSPQTELPSFFLNHEKYYWLVPCHPTFLVFQPSFQSWGPDPMETK